MWTTLGGGVSGERAQQGGFPPPPQLPDLGQLFQAALGSGGGGGGGNGAAAAGGPSSQQQRQQQSGQGGGMQQGPFGEGGGGGGLNTFTTFGAVPVTGKNFYKLLAAGEVVLLFPGGVREAFKRKNEEYRLFWPSKPEFIRMAAGRARPFAHFIHVPQIFLRRFNSSVPSFHL